MYKIMAGDYIVHQSNTIDKDFLAITATIEQSLNKSGTLSFTVPSNNYAFNNAALKKLKVPLIVYYDNKEIWRGRILDTGQDFYNKMTFKCEGWLSVLCDSIVRPEDNIPDTTVLDIDTIPTEFRKLIANHNSQMETIKQFNVHFVGFEKEGGEGEPDDPKVDKTIHELALEVINGDWGNGEERYERLTAAGYDYNAVQTEVNRIIFNDPDYVYEEEEIVSSSAVSETNSSSSASETNASSSTSNSSTPSAAQIIAEAEKWLGATTGDSRHKEIIDGYNSYLPHPHGYEMSYTDAWCAAFVSFVFIQLKATSLISGPECYVDYNIANFQTVSIWQPGTGRTPNPGDLICFNWDGDEESDHIGIVVSVTDNVIKTIEGNAGSGGGEVKYNEYGVNASVIKGYGVPNYGSGTDTGSDKTDTRQYYNTLDYIMEKFINNENVGGTIWCEGNNLYYYADGNYPEDESGQYISFGNNLIDFNNYVDASEVYTCLIPEGKDGLLLTGKKTTPTGKDKLYGIDVSHWNDAIDWSVAKDDLDVVITSVTQSQGEDNPQFENTYNGCKNNGILIGAYKYSYAMSGEESRAEAQLLVSKLNGRSLDFPIFIDLEWENQQWLDESIIRSIIVEFEKVVTDAGYLFGIYCNKYWYETLIPSDMRSKYDFWIASIPYDDDGTEHENLKPSYPECNLVGWQYSFNGSFSWGGTTTAFDLDVFYTDYSSGTNVASGDEVVAAAEESEEEEEEETPTHTIYTQDWVENEQGIELFGRIFRHEEFSDVEDVATLHAKAEEKLAKAIEEATTLEISAFDLSLIDVDYKMLKLGHRIRIISKPHGINDYFICSAVSIDLCNPANNLYTFGVNPKTLTSKYNALSSNLYNKQTSTTNYIVQKEEIDTTKTNIRYTIIGSRIEFDAISFYKLSNTVQLSFTATFKKKVSNGAGIFKFDTKYAPTTQCIGLAYDETASRNFTIVAMPDGTIVVKTDTDVARNDVVSGSLTWQYTEV